MKNRRMWDGRVAILLLCMWFVMMTTTGCSESGMCTQASDCPTQGQTCVEGKCKAENTAKKPCAYEGKTYQEGDSFKAKDGCNDCKCEKGQTTCTTKSCTMTCTYEGKTYQEGDSFKAKDDCNDCKCEKGQATCTKKVCPPPDKTCNGTCSDPKDYCHYEEKDACGEGNEKGTCKPKPTSCDNTKKPVCGCDNKTYNNACQASKQGVSIAKSGPCQSGPAKCGGSVVCPNLKTQYCHYNEVDACGEEGGGTGLCKARPTQCSKDEAPVCGCDGKTYDNACEAYKAGTSVKMKGNCGGSGPARCGGPIVCPDLKKQYCHHEPKNTCGTNGPPGTCKPRPNSCSNQDKPVCGCNDKNYPNACKAYQAGVSVKREGACSGSGSKSCGAKVKCSDPKEYCHYQEKDACGGKNISGTCKPKPKTCTQEKKPVCGCDGKTYDNACKAYAAGISISQQGKCCPGTPVVCGGYFNVKCKGTNDYCHLEPKALCGAADAPGVCKVKPTKCPSTKDTVCGCDGKDYLNPCTANQNGISVSFKGSCKRGTGSCIHERTSYKDGASFTYRCNTCTCQNGKVSCTKKACPPEPCGMKGAPPCPTGYYCYHIKTCGSTGQPGTCKKIRTAPCLIPTPKAVCGCNGRTYRSACDAEIAGISIKSSGHCKCGS